MSCVSSFCHIQLFAALVRMHTYDSTDETHEPLVSTFHSFVAGLKKELSGETISLLQFDGNINTNSPAIH